MSSVAQNTTSDSQQSVSQFQTAPLTATANIDTGSGSSSSTNFIQIKKEDHTDEQKMDMLEKQELLNKFEKPDNIEDRKKQQVQHESISIQTPILPPPISSPNVTDLHDTEEIKLLESLKMDVSNDSLKSSIDIPIRNTTDMSNNITSLPNKNESVTTNLSFSSLSADNFGINEVKKFQQHEAIPLAQATPSELNNLLSEFPNDILDSNISDNTNTKFSNSNSKPEEEEAETVHLHESPDDSMIKGKSYDILNSDTKSLIQNVSSLSITKNNDKLQLNSDITQPHIDESLTTALPPNQQEIQAYAMLDFDSFTFYVQTMQILLGRMVEGDTLTDALDIHLGNQKAISRRHAKIFYNFGNQRFELSVLGRNGAFVDGNFIEKGVTVPLADGTKIQIGETEFAFILPKKEKDLEFEQINKEDTIKTKEKESIKEKGKVKDYHMEHLDNLVANFDEIKNDIQNENDKLLLSKDPNVLEIVFDPENERQRELEIEKEIGKVLAREQSEQATDFEDMTNVKNDTKSKKKSTKSKIKVENNEMVGTDKSKASKPKRIPKTKKKIYTLEEIPEQYRTKPNLPYSILITDVLRKRGTERGMSLSEIYKGIQDLYPYYFYCPDGWQSSVRHNLSLNKSFRKISKEGKGWLWGVNEEVIAEKDRQRQKQLENAKAKGKTLSKVLPKPLQNNLNIQSNDNLKQINLATNVPIQMSNYNVNSIRNNSHQFQPTNSASGPIIINKTPKPMVKEATSNNEKSTNSNNISANTKKALAYLQKELISLTKERKMYDRATSTEILTKALAMTISQVDQAAKNFAIKGFPLVTLIDKNPGHVTKILTAALNAATLQVCKQKGLTPHLPPKSSTTNAPTLTQNTNSTPAPIMKKDNDSQVPILPKPNTKSSTITNTHKSFNVDNESKFNPASKATGGSIVYQFSKPSTQSSHSPTPIMIKPHFKAAAPVKPSFKPSAKLINTNNSISMKPVKLGGSLGTGLMKPQFYAKGKPPSNPLSSSSLSSATKAPTTMITTSLTVPEKANSIGTGGNYASNNSGKDEADDDTIRQSIAKFGKPTGIDSSLNNNSQLSVTENDLRKEEDMKKLDNEENKDVKEDKEGKKSEDAKEEKGDKKEQKDKEDKTQEKDEKKILDKGDKKTEDKEIEEGDDEEEEDDADDELNMMLADLEKDEEEDDDEEEEQEIENNLKKRPINEVDRDVTEESEDKKPKIE